ncbi:MAG: hypothetical protein V1890_00940 [Candidatus Zixiibacteriota bacterium]
MNPYTFDQNTNQQISNKRFNPARYDIDLRVKINRLKVNALSGL